MGRERRRSPRAPGSEREHSDATYIVERDAPPGIPLDPTTRWHKRALARVKQWRFDAYPDHARPFEDVEPEPPAGLEEPLDPSIAVRLPTPELKGPPTRVVVYRGKKGKAVNIFPFNWERPDLWPVRFRGFIADIIVDTIDKLRRDDEGQSLAEYALILALIAIIAIVALIAIGSQVSTALSELGGSI